MSIAKGISSLQQNQVRFSNCVTKNSADKAENNHQIELSRDLDPSYHANFPPLSANVKSKRKTKTKTEVYRNPTQNEQPVQEDTPESKPFSDKDFPGHIDGSCNATTFSGTSRYCTDRAIQLQAAKSLQRNLFLDNYDRGRQNPRIDSRTRFEQIPNDQTLMSSLHEDEATFKMNSCKQPDNHSPRKIVKQSRRFSACINQPFDICIRGRRDRKDINSSLPFDNDLKSIDFDYFLEGNAKILMPGMVLLKRYIPISLQVNIALKCREYGLSKGGFYQPGYEDGAKLRLRMMCFGHDWDPQTRKYSKRRNYDDSEPPDIPHDFSLLVGKALNDSLEIIKQQSRSDCVEQILPIMNPDICIVNFYSTTGRLGLHQDRDESSKSISRGLPVVSFSIGDSAEFLYGEKRDADKAESVLLESGDVVIFGGSSRLIFHGVASIKSKTAPKELVEQAKLRPGRLNLTFRKR